ncbi:MAG: hypothetical protein L0H84_07620 [Pseudonocardia sp.]|nr:hypothetical protein [Pseudonocardia sp.]
MLAVNTPPIDGVSSDDWYRVLDTPAKVGGPTVDLGVRDNVGRAATWYIVTSVMDRLASRPGLGFTKSIAVAYPARVGSGSSYANGITRTAYIQHDVPDAQFVDMVVHEVMQLWNYQHNTGVANWVAAVCFDGDTHGLQEQPAIVIHEGSAEWAKNELMTQLWGRPRVRPTSPPSSAAITACSRACTC